MTLLEYSVGVELLKKYTEDIDMGIKTIDVMLAYSDQARALGKLDESLKYLKVCEVENSKVTKLIKEADELKDELKKAKEELFPKRE